MTDIIILPGIGNSGESHWQTLWERENPAMRRFQSASWDEPDLNDWIAALDRAVAQAKTPPVLVSHSLGCLLVAHWSARSALPVKSALLVSVPDPDSAAFPPEARSFGPTPTAKLGFPALMVSSTDDPFGSPDYRRRVSADWGADLEFIGEAGHINGTSGLGDWPQGKALLARLMRKF